MADSPFATQPYQGIPTFGRRPHTRDVRGADVAILGGSGENDITIIGTDVVCGTSTFGPAGPVIIDGNGGRVEVFGDFSLK